MSKTSDFLAETESSLATKWRNFFRGAFCATATCRRWSATSSPGNMCCLRLRHTLSKSIPATAPPGKARLRLEGRPLEQAKAEVRARGASYVLCHCHWQANASQCLTVLLVHGLEGSSQSQYVLGNTARAWAAGCNVIRMNMRNCGGTEDLSPSLYHSGLSGRCCRGDANACYGERPRRLCAGGLFYGRQPGFKARREMGATRPIT